MTSDEARADDESGGGVDEDGWSPTERALLDAALEFYSAAEGVLDFAGRERPRLRHDAAAFNAVRAAMRLLEERVLAAHAAGATPERIAEIARIEHETIALILARRGVAPSRGDG